MLWKDVGYLCEETEILDSLRRAKKIYTEKKVYCNRKSVRQSEFYQARVQGYKPELMLEIRASDYNEENHFKYNDNMYRVLRTYVKNDEVVEVILTSLVDNG